MNKLEHPTREMNSYDVCMLFCHTYQIPIQIVNNLCSLPVFAISEYLFDLFTAGNIYAAL